MGRHALLTSTSADPRRARALLGVVVLASAPAALALALGCNNHGNAGPPAPTVWDSRLLVMDARPVSAPAATTKSALWNGSFELQASRSTGGATQRVATLTSISAAVLAQDNPPGATTRVTSVRVAIDGQAAPGFTLGRTFGGETRAVEVYVEALDATGAELAEFRMVPPLATTGAGATIDYNAEVAPAPLVIFNDVAELRVELRNGTSNVTRQ